MISKSKLLKNIRNYTPEEIAGAVRAGVVTLAELGNNTDGQFTPTLKRRVTTILAQPVQEEIPAADKPSKEPVETPRPVESEKLVEAKSSTEPIQTQRSIESEKLVETKPSIEPIEAPKPIELERPIEDIPSQGQDHSIEEESELDEYENYNSEEYEEYEPEVEAYHDDTDYNISRSEDSSDHEYNDEEAPRMFSAPFSFKGRIRRSEFIVTNILYFVGILMASFILIASPDYGWVLYAIVCFALIWFHLAQAAKRCHDRGNSGLYMLIPFYVLWMTFGDGDRGNNRYGRSPK